MNPSVQIIFLGKSALGLRPLLPEFASGEDPSVTLSGGPAPLRILVADAGQEWVPAHYDGVAVLSSRPVPENHGAPTLVLPDCAPAEQLAVSIRSFIGILLARAAHQEGLPDIDQLHDIGISLAVEKDLDRLLGLILEKSMTLLRADAGSIYLAEGPSPDQPTHLRFRMVENRTVSIEFSEVVIPINRESLAGYVAATRETLRIDDVYSIPADFPFRFYGAVDEKTGYRSRSLLSVPMIDHRGHLIGVVQMWNKKSAPGGGDVIPFNEADRKLLSSVASQAGVAVENARLYEEINNLFKGFIRASVKAIEARDPTTSGHSERVAKLTVGLAQAVDRESRGPYGGMHFGDEELRELEYAALLHDFGKIGVRESVLVKAKKLYPMELELIQTKLALLHRTTELRLNGVIVGYLSRMLKGAGSEGVDFPELKQQLLAQLERLISAKNVILRSNEPTVLPEDISKELVTLRDLELRLPDGARIPILDDEQILRLSVRKGSLSDEERFEIESHVTHTFRFLEQIPWTRNLRAIPTIAHAHHEKLNGTGYPRRLNAEQIPFPSKVMTVVDIFDALTARDRPYKKAVPVPRALEILDMEVKSGQLDPELLRLFIEARVYELTTTGD